MTNVFAITTRGLETITAQEMEQLGLTITKVAYRRVEAVCPGLERLPGLRTADDVFIKLAEWYPVSHVRTELTRFAERSVELQPEPALAAVRALRTLPRQVRFSVTANFVGRRNYTASEIKMNVGAGLLQRHPSWVYCEDDQDAGTNLRVFIEHDTAVVGIRVTQHPLHRRAYKTDHQPGSLKPTVAAAMLLMARAAPGMTLADPFCGTGTILIEAALQGLHVIGGDIQPAAARHTLANARNAGVPVRVCQWDAQQLPLAPGSVDLAVSNLPWGRQVHVQEDVSHLYREALGEIQRVVRPTGSILLLTSIPQLIAQPEAESLEISLFGQNPHLVRLRNVK